jgi:hypothetical protein
MGNKAVVVKWYNLTVFIIEQVVGSNTDSTYFKIYFY